MKGFASASSTRPPTAKQIAFIKDNYADVPDTFEEASEKIAEIIQELELLKEFETEQDNYTRR